WEVAEHLPAQEGRPLHGRPGPVDREPPPQCLGITYQLALLPLGIGFAIPLLRGSILAIEFAFLLRSPEPVHDTDTARRVLHVQHGLVVTRGDLDRRMLGTVVAPPMSSGSWKP